MRSVCLFVVLGLAFCGVVLSVSASSSWSLDAQTETQTVRQRQGQGEWEWKWESDQSESDSLSEHRIESDKSAPIIHEDAPLIEDMSQLMAEIEKLSEWSPMDVSGSTGTSTTTTTTTSPSPYPPVVEVSVTLGADATDFVANSTWQQLFLLQVSNFLNIPLSDQRIIDLVALTAGSSYTLSFIITSSATSSQTPNALASQLQTGYGAFISLSSMQPLQASPTTPLGVQNLFACPDGTFQANCAVATTTPSSSSSSSLDSFWYYVIGIGGGVGLIVVLTVLYFACCRATDSRLKNEEFRGVELQYEAPFNTNGQAIIAPGLGNSSAASAARQQGLFEEVTLHELEAQQAQQGPVRKRDISVG